MNEELNYTDALEELKQLVDEIENGEISIDDLSVKVKRSAELIRFCRERLHKTEGDIQQVLKELDEASNEE